MWFNNHQYSLQISPFPNPPNSDLKNVKKEKKKRKRDIIL